MTADATTVDDLRRQAAALKAEVDRAAAAPQSTAREAIAATGDRIARFCNAVRAVPRPAPDALSRDLIALVAALDALEDGLHQARKACDLPAGGGRAKE